MLEHSINGICMNEFSTVWLSLYLRRTFPSFAHQIKIPQKDTFSMCEQETELKTIAAFCSLITGLLVLLLLMLMLMLMLCYSFLYASLIWSHFSWKFEYDMKKSNLINLLSVYFFKIEKKELYTSHFHSVININKSHLYTCCGMHNNKLYNCTVHTAHTML